MTHKYLIGVATFALLAGAVAPRGAEAGLLGRKKPVVDFSAVQPEPTPPPPPANGSIFQIEAGYAALYEGSRARRVGDPLTIVLVERTAASKSATSTLDSGGGLSITPPTTGLLSLFKPTDASASTSCDCAMVATTSFARQPIFFGSGAWVPRIHSTCSPLETFHKPGPGCSPVTSTVSSVGAACVVSADSGGGCAIAAENKKHATRARIRMDSPARSMARCVTIRLRR